jgi:hypothetical protein
MGTAPGIPNLRNRWRWSASCPNFLTPQKNSTVDSSLDRLQNWSVCFKDENLLSLKGTEPQIDNNIKNYLMYSI